MTDKCTLGGFPYHEWPDGSRFCQCGKHKRTNFPMPPIGKSHDLKCHPEFFQDIWEGIKTFEVRVNDRDFHQWDELVIREYEPEAKVYSGRVVRARAGYVLDAYFGLLPGYVGMSLLDTQRSFEPDSV